MTPRPTDEEIRAMRQWAYRNRGDIGDKVYQFAEAWLAERQTARNGVIINELDKKDVHKACETFIRESDYTVVCPEEWMAEAIKSIAPPIASVSDALGFLEDWAISGKTLHDDDIQRFHATVERIAPVEQSARVPDAKEPMTAQDEAYADGWNACREAMLSAAPAYNGRKEG